MPKEINIATNNGDIGGGEVMLFNIARALRSLGHEVTIVGPASPSEVVEAAADEGFDVVCLPATTRKQYMAHLRMWDQRSRKGLLWCNGLVPSFATAGHQNRIVHLHQVPQGKLRWLLKFAQICTLKTLVPSKFASQFVKTAEVFPNWVSTINMPLKRKPIGKTISIGFLGRPSVIKGTDTLARAIERLNREETLQFELVIAGESKFVDEGAQQNLQKTLSCIQYQTRFLGWVEPSVLFQQIDILVVPSKIPESFGLVATEAMSARVPLLVSDAGALPEVVGEGYPWIFEQDNVESLIHQMRQITTQLENHSEETEKIINSSYWRWQEEFSPEAGKAHLRELLLEIL
ncbi:glycosyltransferase family 4 protein [Rothia amarae]|uniref:glycosyltransferase family 4 protein n=1 Tax=Rothia amarae TaxID=169480 RepID=UPI0031D60A84